MSHGAVIERYLDRLYEAELHLLDLHHAEEFLEAQAARTQQQALTGLAKLPVAERERLTALLGAPEGKQILTSEPAEQLLLDAAELNAFHREAIGSLEAELRDLATHARDAVRSAARHTGRERADDLADAHRLLSAALKNPIAARNAALWFEMGWTLWKQGEAQSAEDAFYQAVRLSSGGPERFVRHALRHLAHLQVLVGKTEEAWGSTQRLLNDGRDDPQVFLEAARCGALAGNLSEAGRLVGRALEADPSFIGALFAEPDLAALGEARIQALEQITLNARATAEHEAQRWRRAVGQLSEVERLLGQTIPLPPEMASPTEEPTGELSLFAARRVAWRNAQQADIILDEGRQRLKEAIAETREEEDRLRRRIELAWSEKRRWESELASVTEEAERGKFPLHPYNWNNPLTPRRNAQGKHILEIYTSCKANLEQSQRTLTEVVPGLEARQRAAQTRIKDLEAALAQFDAP